MPPECSQHSWFWRFISLMLSFIWSCENPAMQSSYHSMSHTFSALATPVFEKAATARAPTSIAAYSARLILRRVDSIIVDSPRGLVRKMLHDQRCLCNRSEARFVF